MSRKNSITRLSAALLGAAALGVSAAFAAPSGAPHLPMRVNMTPESALPKDVPPGHWAAPSVARVTKKKILTPNANGDFHGDQGVTRYELAVALDRFVKYIEAGRKPLHPTDRRTLTALPAKANDEQKAALRHLSSANFIPANSPLLKNDNNFVTAKVVKDSLSAVVIRLSDRAVAPQKD